MNNRVIPFEVKSADKAEDGSTFGGLGGCYSNLDYCGDIIAPGAFGADIEHTRAHGKIRDEHYNTTGKIIAADDTPAGIYIKARISPTAAGRDQMILVKDEVIDRLSVGYKTLAHEWLENPEAVFAFWASKGYQPTEADLTMLARTGGARLITRAKVYEVSTTWLPANDQCVIDQKSRDGQPVRQSFADHSHRTLASLGELIERAERIRDLRAADGRGLSEKSRRDLDRLKGRIDSLLLATSPAAGASVEADDNALMDSYIRMGERLRGAL